MRSRREEAPELESISQSSASSPYLSFLPPHPAPSDLVGLHVGSLCQVAAVAPEAE